MHTYIYHKILVYEYICDSSSKYYDLNSHDYVSFFTEYDQTPEML